MDGIDILLAAVRWLHAIAAVVWVGGSIFFLLVLRPSLSVPGASQSRAVLETAVNRRFRDLVDVSIIALITTGVIITFDRLSTLPITATYYSILGLKLFAFLTMLLMARDLGSRMGRSWRAPKAVVGEPSILGATQGRTTVKRLLSPSSTIVIMGLVAFLLSALLVHVYESDVAGI